MAKEKMYEVDMRRDAPAERWELAKGTELAGDKLAYELVESDGKGIVSKTLWREVLEGSEFTCPECGSHAFGSSGIGGEHFMGHCHGHVVVARYTGRHQTNPTQPCTFTWQRTEEEDAKVFKGNGHWSPAIATAVVVKQA